VSLSVFQPRIPGINKKHGTHYTPHPTAHTFKE